MDYSFIEKDVQSLELPEPAEPAESNPGRSIGKTFGWFLLLTGVIIFSVVVTSEKGRSILLEKVKILTSRIRRKPVTTEEE